MRGQFEDLTSKRFGRLVVLYKTYYIRKNGKKEIRWHCLCDCGNEIDVPTSSLTHNLTQSCGCIHKEQLSNRNKNSAKYNKYDLSGEYGIGYTFNTNKEFYFDLEDYDLIKNYCWYENLNHYIVANSKGSFENKRDIKLHALVMNTIKVHDLIPDHINGNKSRHDNRKSNLRLATNQENCFNGSLSKNNTSGVIGVRWHSRNNVWEAWIGYNYKDIYLGRYNNFKDAVKARLKAEQKYFGEFAPQIHLYKEYEV